MPVINRFADLVPLITEWRRDLHMHPELGFETHRTSAFVAEQLRKSGCDEVVTGIGRTGVVGVIKGRSTSSGKVIGLRADMDALPIQENTGAAHASKTPGAMHACGHDGHTSMLLGAAQYLAETRNFDGTAIVVFQPAEEGGGGGREMVADGLMDRFGIEEIYGLHTLPGLPVGSFATCPGTIMAATDEIELLIKGKGGHAAYPQTCVDTIVVASHIILAWQSIVARNVNPMKNAVLSVTTIETDSSAHNVIPENARLTGTVRTTDTDVKALIEKRIRQIAESTAEAFGATVTLNYTHGYPATVNSADHTDFAVAVAADVLGPSNVISDTEASMGGEDFAYMLAERPGTYAFIGNGDSASWHHPEFDFNDDAIPFGCSYWSRLVEKAMPLR